MTKEEYDKLEVGDIINWKCYDGSIVRVKVVYCVRDCGLVNADTVDPNDKHRGTVSNYKDFELIVKKDKVRQCLWVKDSARYQCKTCAIECSDRRCPFDNLAAIDKATIRAPRERDEIDEWLEKECNIYAGCCSSIENLKYDVAREVAEKLWNKSYDHRRTESHPVPLRMQRSLGN